MSDDPIGFETLTSLQIRLRKGQISSVELTQACLDRIETLEPQLNAFRMVCPERALAQAKQADRRRRKERDHSPLLGLPYAAKDLFDVAGLPTSAGCTLLENNTADHDSAAVARLDAAGMVMLGKTNTVQFAFGGVGINHHHGTPHNPWHRNHHVPGGSSSGSGVAIASGCCPLALGTDTGGSVRIPASLCGITGLKTTLGQISRAGVYPLSWTLDSVGPLTRTAEDAALAYETLQGADPNDATTHGRGFHDVTSSLELGVEGLRLAFAESVFWDDVDTEVADAVRATGPVFESLAASVTDTRFHIATSAQNLNRRGLIAAAEAWTVNRELMENNFDELDPIVATRMLNGREVTSSDYLSINYELLRLRSRVHEAFADFDALLVPTCAEPARPVGAVDVSPDTYARHNLAYLRNTAIGNMLNLCALSVPCGSTRDGLPIGLMIYARPFCEEMALRVAHAYQMATDFHNLKPRLDWIES